MKLINQDLTNTIIFEENRANIVVIENKKYYIEFIRDILLQINGNIGKFALFSEDKELKINEKMEIIKDIFDIEINNKKIINKIYSELNELTFNNSDLLIQTKNIESELLKYIYNLIENYDYHLEINEDFDIKELFKIFSVKLSHEYTNKLDEIVEYVEIISKILKKEIFIFINFHIFFEKEEIRELRKQFFYKKIKLLFLETEKPDIIDSEDKLFIIDKDLCEINLL